jgi:predicted nucleic acid-binding protein
VIFVDTGAFLARYLPRDNRHVRAARSWKALARRDWKCYTSSFVLDETFTLLARRSSYAFAAERARAIYASKALQILRPAADDEHQALVLFEKYADQEVSFTDCISFTLMKRQHIRRAFAFDRHFKDAGFEVWPA